MENLWIHTDKGTDILTGTGRIVTGDCLKPQDKDATGRPLIVKTGPNAGQPRVQYYIGIAIPKTDPSWPMIQAAIIAEAKVGFPHLFDAAGNCLAPNFAYKYTDGDSTVPNSKGTVPANREGYPGHYVLHLSNGFAPKCFKRGPMGLENVTDPNLIKRGYYVKIFGTVKGNGSAQNPGVFINTNMILMEKVGEEIFSGPDAETVFGGGAATMPPPGTVPPAIPPAAVPPPIAQPPIAPPVTPAPDFANGPGAVPPAAPPPLPPAAEKTYNINGVVHSHSQLIAAGWSEAQIAALPPF